MKLFIFGLSLILTSFSTFSSMTEAEHRSDASLKALDYEFSIAISKAEAADKWNLKYKKSIIISNFNNSTFKCETQLTRFKNAGTELMIAQDKEIEKVMQAKTLDAYNRVAQNTSHLEKTSLESFEELLGCIE